MTLPKTSQVVATIIAGVVLALILWFTTFGGWDTVKGWVGRPMIDIRSSTRPFAKSFYVGEKLRVVLGNVTASRVIWLFDEDQVVRGTTEVEYAFKQDPLAQPGSSEHRRVDAFMKIGESYSWTSKWVDVDAVNFQGKIEDQGKQLVLSAPSDVSSKWTLAGVSISGYKNGKFTEAATLTKKAALATDNYSEWLLADRAESPPLAGLKDLVETSDKGGGSWIEYRFKGTKEGDALTLLGQIPQATLTQVKAWVKGPREVEVINR
jgi:hypothetical protein